jgi:hypothetical protein
VIGLRTSVTVDVAVPEPKASKSSLGDFHGPLRNLGVAVAEKIDEKDCDEFIFQEKDNGICSVITKMVAWFIF